MAQRGHESIIPTTRLPDRLGEMAMSKNTLADDICQHVGCFNIASWLYDLATQLHVGSEELMPVPPKREHCLDIPKLGLRLTLKHPHAGHVNVGDPARWILTEADFSLQRKNARVQHEAVPFGPAGTPRARENSIRQK